MSDVTDWSGERRDDDESTPYAAVVRRAESAMTTAPSDITSLMRTVLERDGSVETLEKLVALHERVSDRAAAIEFAAALADFQAACPPIPKNHRAKIVGRSGGSFEYTFADLHDIATTVRPLLHARGFAYTFDSSMDGKMLVCTCVLRHINGHKETATFSCPVESAAGMTEQQKHASALTYARRMSLTAVLGITTADLDTDGGNPKPITRAQAEELRSLADEVGADTVRYLRHLGYPSFEEIRRDDYNRAKLALESKRVKEQKRGDKR